MGGSGTNGINYTVFETCLKKLVDVNVWIDTNMAVYDYASGVRTLNQIENSIKNPSTIDMCALIHG